MHPPSPYLMDGYLSISSTSTSAFSHLIFNDTNAHSINSWQSVSPTCHHCSIISPYRRAIPRVFRWRIQNWAPRRWHRRDRPLDTVDLLLCVYVWQWQLCRCLCVICIVGVKVGGGGVDASGGISRRKWDERSIHILSPIPANKLTNPQ